MRSSSRSVLAIAVLAVVLGACGGGGSDDSASMCDAAQAFQRSAMSLSQMSVSADGADAVTTAIQDLQTQATALADVARDQLSEEARAVAAAYESLASDVSTAENPAEIQQAVTSGVANIHDQQAALEEDIASSCPS